MYKAYILPILIYGSPFWSPLQRRGCNSIGKKFSGDLPNVLLGNKNMSYSKRLRSLGFLSLKSTRFETIYNSHLEFVNVTVHEVYKLLFSQKYSVAGLDGLSGRFYKQLTGPQAPLLTIIFQQFLHQKAIPDSWKWANITPLYKSKGEETTAASSYRPISLANIACKILERLVADQVRLFWLSHGLLCEE